ncbi:hypothetical protein FMUND_610 [Fusarium mundagurra]|uniref:Uncharacterized protein n=1 Tax=Fusarium mundagurra TaxID=1567541 RepID=A0A8H5Z8A8_9HYPO|nr:hypothetical protein FMUND_610 [Fusarium mundagurra]
MGCKLHLEKQYIAEQQRVVYNQLYNHKLTLIYRFISFMTHVAMEYQNQLVTVPETSIVRTWQQPAPVQQQPSNPACFVSRLAGELLLSRTDNMNLRHMSTQLQQDVGSWRQEYEKLLVEYWKISEHNAALLGQVSRLKEQVRATRPKRGNNRGRRDDGIMSLPVQAGSSDIGSNEQEAVGDE